MPRDPAPNPNIIQKTDFDFGESGKATDEAGVETRSDIGIEHDNINIDNKPLV